MTCEKNFRNHSQGTFSHQPQLVSMIWSLCACTGWAFSASLII